MYMTDQMETAFRSGYASAMDDGFDEAGDERCTEAWESDKPVLCPEPDTSPLNLRVNLNGTSRESLCDQFIRIDRACRKVDAALAEATPHGRDYQTVSTSIIEQRQARDQDLRRWAKARDHVHAVRVIAAAFMLAISSPD